VQLRDISNDINHREFVQKSLVCILSQISLTGTEMLKPFANSSVEEVSQMVEKLWEVSMG
jgi:hypothetical protein